MAELPEEGEAEDSGDRTPTNVVIFRSALMGISMDRQGDGHVWVLKVTEPSTNESVDRVGRIALRDRVLDAARIDLRDPITEEEWRRMLSPRYGVERFVSYNTLSLRDRSIRFVLCG